MRSTLYAPCRARSTFLCLVTSVGLLASPAAAQTPDFSKGGFLLQLQYGPTFWDVDGARLDAQTGESDPGGAGVFVGDLVTSHAVSLGLAYNILGHVSLGADLTATGWDLTNNGRGGGGFVIGKLAWHPLALLDAFLDKRPTEGLEASTFFGVGYGLVGENRGMDGVVFEWGFLADYFFARYVGVGLFVRGVFLNFDRYYLDYENREVAGNTLSLRNPLPGGSMWTLGLTLTFRAGE